MEKVKIHSKYRYGTSANPQCAYWEGVAEIIFEDGMHETKHFRTKDCPQGEGFYTYRKEDGTRVLAQNGKDIGEIF